MDRLKEKVAVVTGAANGIGRATAELFGREGAHVVGVDMDANEIAGTALALSVDVRDEAAVDAMVAQVLERFGRIDVLAHYAGITRDALHRRMTLDQWNDVIRVNLTGSFLIAKAVAAPMVEANRGSIILTSSRSYLGNVGQANYAASKGGVVSLMRTLALELGRSNVRVNALAPGFIETRMTAVVPDKVRDKAIEVTPLKRTGRPEEVAAAALFLASDESSFITGQVIAIDGGRTVGVAPA